MAVELEITWEGNVPGLDEHRLSLGAFGDSLTALLAALRRIANNIVGEAIEDEGATTGRFTSAARQLDIQIVQIKKASSGFGGYIELNTQPGQNMPLFNDLPQTAGLQLLDAVELESKGTMKLSAVRKYLRALPVGISRQTYRLVENGSEIKRVVISSMELPDPLYDLPYIVEYTGSVIGVGFDPGKAEVRIRTEDDHQRTLLATPVQVERALELRGSTVRILAVGQEAHFRLLRLQEAGLPWSRPTREEAIFERWDGLLRRLAQ
jgi:hypothetical protein